MAYCPQCGKKSPNDFADFCSFCGGSMKSLGSVKPSPVVVTPPAPQIHSMAPDVPKSRIQRLKEERAKALAGSSIEQEEEESSPGEVNIQHSQDFDSMLAGGLEVEFDSNKPEKMFFALPPKT